MRAIGLLLSLVTGWDNGDADPVRKGSFIAFRKRPVGTDRQGILWLALMLFGGYGEWTRDDSLVRTCSSLKPVKSLVEN